MRHPECYFMIISEKQIMQLMFGLQNIMSRLLDLDNHALDPNVEGYIGLLNDIVSQQSEELKEVK